MDEELIYIEIDFPKWMINALDKEAAHIGVARQALIKMLIAEKLTEIEKAA